MTKKAFYIFMMVLAIGITMTACAIGGTGMDLTTKQISSPAVIVRAEAEKNLEAPSYNDSDCQVDELKVFEVPRLVLFDHHRLTDPFQRTLHIDINGLQIPLSGATVTLKVETQTSYPELGTDQDHRIPIWVETIWIDADETAHPAGSSFTFSHTFTETVATSADQPIHTPFGYFRYQIIVKDGGDETVLYEFHQENAFLIENQCMSEWRVEVDGAQKVAVNAKAFDFVTPS